MIATARIATDEEWWEHVNQDENATFFQTPEWHEIWNKYLGLKRGTIFFRLDNGKTGVMPISFKTKYHGIIKKHMLSPAGTYGGIVSRYKLEAVEFESIYQQLLGTKSFILRTGPLPIGSPHSLHLNALKKSDFTNIVVLSDIIDNNILRNWRKGHKADAKRALREGVEISVTREENDFKEYFYAYEESLKRWADNASSKYEYRLFDLIRKGSPRNKIKLWKAVYEGKLIYGCLCFYHQHHVVYWHGAGLSNYFKLGAVHALQRGIIQDAIENGYKYYDFNPSGGHEGVEKFKDGFGTVKTDASIYIHISFLEKIFNKLF